MQLLISTLTCLCLFFSASYPKDGIENYDSYATLPSAVKQQCFPCDDSLTMSDFLFPLISFCSCSFAPVVLSTKQSEVAESGINRLL